VVAAGSSNVVTDSQVGPDKVWTPENDSDTARKQAT
jgi:hypothetical protein